MLRGIAGFAHEDKPMWLLYRHHVIGRVFGIVGVGIDIQHRRNPFSDYDAETHDDCV